MHTFPKQLSDLRLHLRLGTGDNDQGVRQEEFGVGRKKLFDVLDTGRAVHGRIELFEESIRELLYQSLPETERLACRERWLT